MTYTLSDILPDSAVFKWQLQSSQLVRNAYGVSLEKGKLVVIDKTKLEKVEPWKKDVIREFWKEVNK